MPFAPDGTYIDPAQSDGSGGNPGGTGQNGETWDPNSKRWIPKGAPGSPAPSAPVGAGGWSNLGGSNYGGPSTQRGEGPASTGKAGTEGAYGGYSGHFVDDGNGGVVFDGMTSGRQAAVDRLTGLGNAAGAQQAYQNDYSNADRYAAAGQADRGFQTDAMNLAKQTAMGQNLQSQKLGQQMLQQGVQAQQAGAASTRGGSLAAASAMRQQQAGQGAFMQQGNVALDAQRAAEMAQGRDAYMQQATGLRASDAQAQAEHQREAEQQMQNELGQRQLGQKGQMGYMGLGQDVNIVAANAALGQHEQNAGIEDKSMQRHQGKLDQTVGYVGDAAKTAGSVGSSASGMGGGSSTGSGDPDPYSKAVSASDVRSKSSIRGLGYAASVRRGAR